MAKAVSDKVALVTGGGSGIGRASALAFAHWGARVIVADRAVEGGEETVHLIKQEDGQATFIRVDVSRACEVEALLQQTIELYGRLDYAFNNAGVEGEEAGTLDYSEEGWDRVLATNLKGVWMCMKYEIPPMLQRGGGAIVNTSSVVGLVGDVGMIAYTASKHGVIGLTRAAALEFAQQGIRVNAICPGIVRTPMIERMGTMQPDMAARLVECQPIGRIAEPEEVAQAVIWLCSDAASFMTGVALPVDGGWTAQ